MADRKEVINALELCGPYGNCHPNDCPYFTKPSCLERLKEDTLELLKAQEPQPAIIEGPGVIRIGQCPSCNVVLQPWGANYCYKCGQAVKWE